MDTSTPWRAGGSRGSSSPRHTASCSPRTLPRTIRANLRSSTSATSGYHAHEPTSLDYETTIIAEALSEAS